MRCLPCLLVASSLALTACPPDEVLDTPPGGFSGFVCDPVTGRAAAGARAFVTFETPGLGEQTKETTADDGGFIELAGIGVGAQTLHVETDKFQRTFDITIQSSTTFPLVDTACDIPPPLPGTGTLVGQICNRHTGETLTQAQIVLTFSDGTVVDTNTTDDTGSFSIPVPTGTVVVTVVGTTSTYRKTYVVEVGDGEVVEVERNPDCNGAPLLNTGFITGDLCDPEATGAPLVGALVTASWQDGEGDSVEEVGTVTDAAGHFELQSLDPDDNITVRVVDDRGFAFSWQVRAGENGGPLQDRTVMPDGINLTADQTCQPLLPDDGRRYLVVEGIYDRIEDALVRNGIDPDIEPFPQDLNDWANDLFSNQQRVSQYDVIFINCGAEDHELAIGLSAAAKTGLRRYVEQGGALYVSDWSYEFVEQVFPEKVDFFGLDTTFDGAQQAVGGTYPTRVLDADLRDALDVDQFDISFSFQAGSIISQVAEGVTVYLETDMHYAHDGVEDILVNTPVTVGFDAGLGRVIFTSFHQEQNPDNEDFVDVLNGTEDEVLQYLIFTL